MPRFAETLRYWHTLRHLRPVQFHGRAWFRLYRPRPDMSPPPPLGDVATPWIAAAARRPSLVGPRAFELLNQAGSLDEAGWDDPGRDKLWRYHQHYFDDLNAADAGERAAWHRALIDDWIAGNPPGRGSGWEPYPTALRIVNWIKWALAGQALSPAAVASLAVQARWLRGRLEWHLLGNHLFVNAKALVFAGLFFGGREARRWRSAGVAILRRELDEQILDDGGHFELSPMYHALILEDLLDLANLLRAFGPSLDAEDRALLVECEAWVPAMRRWLRAMSHGDGDIALFNDAAFAIAPPGAELAGYAARLGFGDGGDLPDAMHLSASGYARLARGEALLIADMAAVGPDYIPGHAHADTLACEFSLGAQRIIVNGGTSVYGAGPERLRQRGTAAHSTVVVAGRNSSDVWGGFRVARRARVHAARLGEAGGVLEAAAAHDGYRILPGRPIHHRRWLLSGDRLRVEDRLDPAAQDAAAIFHLHPDVVLESHGPSEGRLILPGGRAVRWRAEGGETVSAAGSWHPEFGRSIPNRHIVVPLRDGRSAFELIWA